VETKIRTAITMSSPSGFDERPFGTQGAAFPGFASGYAVTSGLEEHPPADFKV